MKGGETAKVFCPADLAQGGNINQYTDFGSGWVPQNTDMTYELHIVECALDPHEFHIHPPLENLKESEIPDET